MKRFHNSGNVRWTYDTPFSRFFCPNHGFTPNARFKNLQDLCWNIIRFSCCCGDEIINRDIGPLLKFSTTIRTNKLECNKDRRRTDFSFSPWNVEAVDECVLQLQTYGSHTSYWHEQCSRCTSRVNRRCKFSLDEDLIRIVISISYPRTISKYLEQS